MLSVAVNLSASSLVDAELPQRVWAALRDRGLPPDALELEITEDFLMGDRERARAILGDLRRLGIRVAVDDFGTGYSSLAYLRELPIDELKLDRSFVAPMGEDPRAAAIVRSTIELAHSLGMTMVAEGVEDGETAGPARPVELRQDPGLLLLQGAALRRARGLDGRARAALRAVACWVVRRRERRTVTVTAAGPRRRGVARQPARSRRGAAFALAVELAYGRARSARSSGELDRARRRLRRTADGPAGLAAGQPCSGTPAAALGAAGPRREPGRRSARSCCVDHIAGPARPVLTTLAGTDGGHRGAILTSDPTVAHALGDALRTCPATSSTGPPRRRLGPLPAGTAVVDGVRRRAVRVAAGRRRADPGHPPRCRHDPE